MPLQKPQASKASALPRRNISKTSTSSTSITAMATSKIARLSPLARTTLSGTSDSDHHQAKVAATDIKPKVKKFVSFKLTSPEAPNASASACQTPKTSTFNSIKSFASKIARITPSKKSDTDTSTPRRASESLPYDASIRMPLAPQKAKGAYSITNNVPRIDPVSFDIYKPTPEKTPSKKATATITEVLTTKHTATPLAPQKAKGAHTITNNVPRIDPVSFDIYKPTPEKTPSEQATATTTKAHIAVHTAPEPTKLTVEPSVSTLCIVSKPPASPAVVPPASSAADPSASSEEVPPASSAAVPSTEVNPFTIDGAVSSKSSTSTTLRSPPTKFSVYREEHVPGIPGIPISDQADVPRPSIEQSPEPERRRIFSTSDYLNQKRRQFSSAQTPCPGDAKDEHTHFDHAGRTFPSIRKLASKMARIMPANRPERGGTHTPRYQTPEEGYRALSADPTTIGSSPSPYRMNLSPESPGAVHFVRTSDQLELLNTIQEYVVEAERHSSELQRHSDELVSMAEELLDLGEKEREEWLLKERALKARIQELEQEAATLRAERGDDYLGVTGANPVTGVWSDVGGAGEGEGEGGKKKKGRKGRGRWRRTDSSWVLGESSGSTGTIIRTRPDNPAAPESSSARSIIRCHVHHHHHWRVGGARRSS